MCGSKNATVLVALHLPQKIVQGLQTQRWLFQAEVGCPCSENTDCRAELIGVSHSAVPHFVVERTFGCVKEKLVTICNAAKLDDEREEIVGICTFCLTARKSTGESVQTRQSRWLLKVSIG